MTEQELIKALEAATGPSRELDKTVLLACGWTRRRHNSRWKWVTPDHHFHPGHIPKVTYSIDAALTLVDPKYFVQMRGDLPEDGCDTMTAVDLVELPDGKAIYGVARTFAIALCVAALKARVHQDKDGTP